MNQRWLVTGLFAVSVALVVWQVLPKRLTASATRREAELWRSQAERTARRPAPHRTTQEAARAEGGPAAGVRRVRRDVLDVVAALPLSGVTLEVRESPTLKTAVDVKLAAKGRFADLVELTGRLSRTPGLALGVVRFGPRDELARVEVEARSR